MAIVIDNLEIITNGTQLAIEVHTNLTYKITSILAWTMPNYKDYSLAIDLTPYLLKVNEKETLIINASDVGLTIFEDIIYIEVESDYIDVPGCQDCQSPATGITYNLTPYYYCLLSFLLELEITNCVDCDKNKSNQMVITINMLIDSVIKALQIGYYTQAYQMVTKLKKLCSLTPCTDCIPINCSTCSGYLQA